MLRFLWFVFRIAVTLPHRSVPAADSSSQTRASTGESTEDTPWGPVEPAPSAAVGSGVLRASALAVLVLPLALLLVASRLEPNSQGLGTHQQLGLPPCSMRVLFGIRCPGCGMTTSWAHFTRGQLLRSWQVNPGGCLLACFSLVVAGLAMRSCWTVQLPSLETQKNVTITLVIIGAVTLIDWVMRLTTG